MACQASLLSQLLKMVLKPVLPLALTLLVVGSLTISLTSASSDTTQLMDATPWEEARHWSVQPVCVPIPRNMSLCRDIGYTRLRVPNLLRHESLSEILQQAASWTPLLNLHCDPDTRLFLCSLHAPICLKRDIFPCRSLCEKVRDGCEGRMMKWGFPWPERFRCEQFPADNGLCIRPQADKAGKAASGATTEPPPQDCQVCGQTETKENIMDHYCRADVVVAARFRRIQPETAQLGKTRIFRPQKSGRAQRRALRKTSLRWRHQADCCPLVKPRKGRYLVMARRGDGGQLTPTLIMPWKSNQLFRSLRPLLRRFDCADSRAALRQHMLPSLLPPSSRVVPSSAPPVQRRRGGTAQRRRKRPRHRGAQRRRKQGSRRRPEAGGARADQTSPRPRSAE